MDDSLQLPQLGLFADLESGRASVRLSDELLQAPSAVRLAVIRQWQAGLQAEFQSTLVRHYREKTAEQRDVALPVRLSQFHRACAAEGVLFPENFAILLQQLD